MSLDISQLSSKMQSLAKNVSVDSIPAVKKGLEDLAKDYKAFNNTEHGKVLGALKGGFKGLTQEIDNAVDALSSIDKPTITKLDATAHQGLKTMKTALANNAGAISSLVSSSHGSGISAIAPAAKAFAAAAPGMVDNIISDGAPEALAHVLTKVKGEKLQDVTNLLKETADKAVAGDLDKAVTKLLKNPGLGDLAATDLPKVLGGMESALNNALGGLSSGNLLKDLNEKFSGNLLNQVVNLTNTVQIGDVNAVVNQLLAGNKAGAIQNVISQLKIPEPLLVQAQAFGIDLKKSTDVNQLYKTLNTLENSTVLDDLGKSESAKIRALVEKLDTEFENVDTSIAANVSQGTPTRNPVVDPSQYNKSQTDYSNTTAGSATNIGSVATGSGDGNFPFLNSKEEIIKYLQSATREITTVVWHWTANYTDQGYIGSEAIDKVHRARGWAGIGYHFIVKRDGSIQIGRDINKTGAHVGGFNTRSVGISFVAGYKCTSDKYKGIPPHSEVGPESITQAQHEAFKAFMSAWYTVFPGGCAYGHMDFPRNSGKVDPGFDVGKRCYELFGKRNVGHPQKDDRILTFAEINQKRSIA